MALPLPNLDDRTYADLIEEARSLIPTEYPEWTDHNPSDSGIVLLEMFAWLTEMMLYRVNQVPDQTIEVFLKLLQGDPGWSRQDLDLPTAIRETVLGLRKRYRAVTPEDFEQLALHDWPDSPEAQPLGMGSIIQRVKCLPQVNLGTTNETARRLAPGHINLVIVPANESFYTLQFDGQASYLSINLDEPETEVTHEFWFKTDDPNCGLFCVVDQNLGGGGHDRHIYLRNGNIKVRIYNSEEKETSGPSLADNQWHHVAHVFGTSIGGQKIYIDGQEQAKGNKASSDFNWQKRINVGFSNDAAHKYCKGQMAEVRIWRRALQTQEIQANQWRQLTGREEGLLGYWPLDEGSGDRACDRTPNQRHGTLNGTRWITDTDLKLKRLPWANPALRKALWLFLNQRRLLTTQHHVVNPEFVPITLKATLRLQEGASAVALKPQHIDQIRRFFDPLKGGPNGQGWPFGRSVYRSDVYELLDNLPGVDYVETLALQDDRNKQEIALEDYQLVDLQLNPADLSFIESWQQDFSGR